MNDEIKEILEKLKDGIGKFEEYDNNALLESDECEILLDYITNLQQEVRINNDLILYFKNKQKELKKEITNLQHTENLYNQLLKDYDELQQELEEYKDTETYSKRFLYKANKDRLNANLDLVKENEKLKEHKEYYKNETKRLGKLFYITKEENIKLQQRIEKAVEYIKQYGNLYCLKHQQFKKYYQYEELLNILNGRSDEE